MYGTTVLCPLPVHPELRHIGFLLSHSNTHRHHPFSQAFNHPILVICFLPYVLSFLPSFLHFSCQDQQDLNRHLTALAPSWAVPL